MHCDLCQRPASDDRSFNCALCAQVAVYQPRLGLAHSFLENEALEKDVERHLVGGRTQRIPSREQKPQAPHPAWTVERAGSDQAVLVASTADILSHVKTLREEVQHMKLDIAKRKARLTRRRKDLASAKNSDSLQTLEPPKQHEEDTRRTRQEWETVHQATMTQRLARCTQTARFFSLQQQKRRNASATNDVYTLGFLAVPDLKDLNSTLLEMFHKSNLTPLQMRYLRHFLHHFSTLRA